MRKICITEDNAEDREKLAGFVKQYFDARGEAAEIILFDDGDVLVEEYPSPDILLMDIEMKHMDGIAAARKIRETDEHVLLVFVTNMVNQALEGYSVDASDFIIKPVQYPSFASRMDRVMKKLISREDRFLEVHSGRDSLFVNVHDILWIETGNKKTAIRRTDGASLPVTEPLYSLEEKLGSGFFRCHSAFLVNMEHVRSVTQTDALLADACIPISKHRRKEFMTALASFKGGTL